MTVSELSLPSWPLGCFSPAEKFAGALYVPRVILLNTISAMIEIVIERWTNAEGETDFRWSVWSEEHRIQMAEKTHSNADDCEVEAVDFCWRELGRKPDKVTRL